MCTISFFSFPTMKVDVHNQCPDFKLIDQKCFSYGAEWHMSSAREVGSRNMMSIEFKYSPEAFRGVVIYKLGRTYVKSKPIHLFLVWKSDGYKRFRVYVRLLEYDKPFVWSEIRLKEYYQRCTHQLHTYTDPIEDTWLIPDGILLMTRLELAFVKRDGKLKVTISEGIRDSYIKRPEWINLER
jgi:hypothetical protein